MIPATGPLIQALAIRAAVAACARSAPTQARFPARSPGCSPPCSGEPTHDASAELHSRVVHPHAPYPRSPGWWTQLDDELPSEAYLILEVAESSLALDRGKKLRLYASCAVPEYWVVNLPERCIEVYTGPSPGAYAHCERYEHGQAIRLSGFPDVVIAVADVLR